VTLLVIVALATPVHAETHVRLGFELERRAPRTEVATPPAAATLARIDLSAFASPRTQYFTAIEVPEPAAIDLFELRDNVARDWAPDRDFELAAMWSSISIAINHHVLDRNWDEAQITATFTRDF
jgi:hypothetical protein